MNLDKAATDVFDFIARIVGSMESSKAPEMPDLSGISIDHLITDEQIADPAKFYAPSDIVPDIEWKQPLRLPFIEITDGVFPSPVQTAFPENNTVYIKHYRVTPRRKGRPCVVMINGLNVNSNFYFDWYCWRYAAWGLDSALVTMPYAQQRVPEGSFCGQFTITPETKWTLLSLKQSFMDTQQFINWLKADGTGQVGIFGISYGGLMAGLCACQDPNIEFAVMCMPPVDMQDLLTRWDYAEEWRRREAEGETTLMTDPRVPPVLSLCRMKPKPPHNKMFIAAGEFDHLVPIETVHHMAENWGGNLPWLKIYPTGHINTFALNFRFIADLERFIKKEIMR